MEIRCIPNEAIPANMPDDIDQKRLASIRLSLTADTNEYNTLYMQRLLSEWGRKIFHRKIRRVRDTEVNLKPDEDEAEKESIVRSLLTSIEDASTYERFDWMQKYNVTTWNDTEVNRTLSNATTITPTKYKDKLIFGYFRLYVLILLAILVILLLAITALACYYDCENRRGHLLGGKYGSSRKDTAPVVAVKYEGKQSGIIDKRKATQESSAHSRTLRKRKMLIEARRSASTKSVTCSDFGDSAMFNKDIPKLPHRLEEKLLEDDQMQTAKLQDTQRKRSESMSDEALELSSTESESQSEEGSETGSEDL
ncbi:unnamed protein product [Litomosoides sigmodontis]|uniref:Uncharacterized protein n=1 Tax=Litomosoides sigmodontis TaxID=42156 RepID=A0A3P6TMC2_LITSI|nr:unnamed protein product [Litomosoides sigmodontis]